MYRVTCNNNSNKPYNALVYIRKSTKEEQTIVGSRACTTMYQPIAHQLNYSAAAAAAAKTHIQNSVAICVPSGKYVFEKESSWRYAFKSVEKKANLVTHGVLGHGRPISKTVHKLPAIKEGVFVGKELYANLWKTLGPVDRCDIDAELPQQLEGIKRVCGVIKARLVSLRSAQDQLQMIGASNMAREGNRSRQAQLQALYNAALCYMNL